MTAPAPRRRLDWQEAYARLERARRALEAGGAPSAEEIGRVLSDRARRLARPLAPAVSPAPASEVLVVTLDGERYGIETAHVQDVAPLGALTPVPCVPPFVLGVVTRRGRVLPVLDLRRLLDLPGRGVPEGSRVVMVEAGGMTFGLFTDAVTEVRRVGATEVAPPPAVLAAGRRAVIRGVTGDLVAVLDLEALARDPRIVVNEEGG